MTPRIYTTGNARPYIERTGYQDRMRVPGPIEPMERKGWLRRILGRG